MERLNYEFLSILLYPVPDFTAPFQALETPFVVSIFPNIETPKVSNNPRNLPYFLISSLLYC